MKIFVGRLQREAGLCGLGKANVLLVVSDGCGELDEGRWGGEALSSRMPVRGCVSRGSGVWSG